MNFPIVGVHWHTVVRIRDIVQLQCVIWQLNFQNTDTEISMASNVNRAKIKSSHCDSFIWTKPKLISAQRVLLSLSCSQNKLHLKRQYQNWFFAQLKLVWKLIQKLIVQIVSIVRELWHQAERPLIRLCEILKRLVLCLNKTNCQIELDHFRIRFLECNLPPLKVNRYCLITLPEYDLF